MKTRWLLMILLLPLVGAPALADDDDWDDDYYEHKHDKGEYKEKFFSNGCEVEREWKRDEYEEKVKCKRRHGRHYGRPVLHYPVLHEVPGNLPPLPPGPVYGDYYRGDRGQYCREYQAHADIGGDRQIYGTACLQPDGSWSFGGGGR